MIRLSHSNLAAVFKENDDHESSYEYEQVDVVGPANTSFTVPDPCITQQLNSTFSLHPAKNADAWERLRRPLEQQEWSRVRPEEHEEFTKKQAENV